MAQTCAMFHYVLRPDAWCWEEIDSKLLSILRDVKMFAKNPACLAQDSAAFSIFGKGLSAKKSQSTAMRAVVWSRMALPKE